MRNNVGTNNNEKLAEAMTMIGRRKDNMIYQSYYARSKFVLSLER